jgi:hypothetical protein
MASQQSKPFSQPAGDAADHRGQIAMVVQNFDLVAELEYKTMVKERTRLAREIMMGWLKPLILS